MLAFGEMLICYCDDRCTLEQNGALEPRKSVLEDDFEEEEEKEENEGMAGGSEDEKVTAFYSAIVFIWQLNVDTNFFFYRIITVGVLKEKERGIGDVTVIDTGIWILALC